VLEVCLYCLVSSSKFFSKIEGVVSP